MQLLTWPLERAWRDRALVRASSRALVLLSRPVTNACEMYSDQALSCAHPPTARQEPERDGERSGVWIHGCKPRATIVSAQLASALEVRYRTAHCPIVEPLLCEQRHECTLDVKAFVARFLQGYEHGGFRRRTIGHATPLRREVGAPVALLVLTVKT